MASKVTFKIKLRDIVNPNDLKDLNPTGKKQLREGLSDFIIEKILQDTSKQRSAVTGQQWKGLSKDYKKSKTKIAGNNKANLELYGDMLKALRSKKVPNEDEIEIGIFNRKQAQKADGHCHTEVFGTSELPPRKFLPKETGTLRPGIMKEVRAVARDMIQISKANKEGDDNG